MDPQLGNFIEHQIQLIDEIADNCVIALSGNPNISTISLSKKTEAFTTIKIEYPSIGNKYKRYKQYVNALHLGLEELLKDKFSPDIIHTHVAGRNLWVAKKYFKETPLVHSEHWSGFLNGKFNKLNPISRAAIAKNLNRANKVLSVSDELSKSIPFKKKAEIANIGNVVLPAEITNSNRLTPKNFLVVADLVDETKNISGIIKAVSRVKDITLSIIGDGPDSDKLKSLCEELDLNERINFKGRMLPQEVVNTYKDYDCLIVNSLFETYSMVTLEALRTGIPVLSSKCGGPQQFIKDVNGILHDNDDELAQNLLKITDLEFNTNEIRASVKEHGNSSLFINTLEKVYSDLI